MQQIAIMNNWCRLSGEALTMSVGDRNSTRLPFPVPIPPDAASFAGRVQTNLYRPRRRSAPRGRAIEPMPHGHRSFENYELDEWNGSAFTCPERLAEAGEDAVMSLANLAADPALCVSFADV